MERETTARALATLPPRPWRSFHDVQLPGRRFATIDHVLVGPSGVFVIDTMAWSGDVVVRDGVLRQNRRRRDQAVTGALRAAEAVRDLLPVLDPATVQPVLCLARDEVVLGWSREVMVCSTANVATLLGSRPGVLDERAVAGVAELLATMLRAATDPVVPVVASRLVSGPARPASEAQQRRQRLRSALTIVLTGIVAVVALTFALPVLAPTVEQVVKGPGIPTVPLGSSHTVAGNPLRPELVLDVHSLVPTRQPGRAAVAVPGRSLVAASVTIRNTGFKDWSSAGNTRFRLVGPEDRGYDHLAGVGRVRSGRVLPGGFSLEPGQSIRGVVVFEVPRRFAATALHIGVGPGLMKTVAWRVDPTTASR